MRDPLFRLTSDGGIPICRGNLDKIAIEITAQHDGRRYVRRADEPLTVMTIDIERDEYTLHHAGSLLAPDQHSLYANWPALLWRQLGRMLRPQQDPQP